MWELDCEESWALKNWCFWTVVLEKTLESPLDCKEIQSVHSEGDQPWVFFGRTGAKAETPILWPPHAESWFIGKDSDAGRDWGQEEKGTTEDEMAVWHHRLEVREFEWTLGVGGGQRGLACCNSWGHKESDMTERLNWTELNYNGVTLYMRISDNGEYFPGRRDYWDSCGPETFATRGLGPITAHWVAYHWNFRQTYEWVFPAPWDKMAMKCPPNHSQNHGHKGALLLETGTFCLPLQIKSWTLHLLTFNIPWMEFRVKIRN